MLAEARRKLGILLIQGAAEALPVADASIDFLTLGYALRHIPDLTRALREFRRVLRPGGTLLILELRRPRYAVTRSVVAQHFSKLVPLFCRWVTGASETRRLMEYHWETIEQSLPVTTRNYVRQHRWCRPPRIWAPEWLGGRRHRPMYFATVDCAISMSSSP
jgi:demethylmenaquinone methyltransferase / 2-methoxy-6-polyprenyl-1,4-benzoquinol methylase